jgi:hypothetical protein
MRQVTCCFLMALLTVVALAPKAVALSLARPHSYSVVTEGGRYVFVMLAPAGREGHNAHPLRAMYPCSGLYRNDGSRDPLWTVDWYSFRVHPASDGVHLVCVIGWGEDSAVTFYASGRLIRGYSEGELLGFSPSIFHLGDSSSGSGPMHWFQDECFDDANHRYSVTAWGGSSHTFDVTTGEVVSRFRPVRWAVWGALLASPLLVWVVYRLSRRRRAAKAAPEPKAPDAQPTVPAKDGITDRAAAGPLHAQDVG